MEKVISRLDQLGLLDTIKNNSNFAREWLFWKRVNEELEFIPAEILAEGGRKKMRADALALDKMWMYRLNVDFDIREYAKNEFRAYMEMTKNRYLVFHKTGVKGSPASVCKAPNRYSAGYTRKVKKALATLFKYDYRSAVFLTLTISNSAFPNKEAMWRGIAKEWNRFKTALFKRILVERIEKWELFGAKGEKPKSGRIPYIMVVEAQKRGAPHIHVLFLGVSRLMDWREIEHLWGLGWQHINRTGEGRKIVNPIAYMSKYITKTFTKTNKENELTQAFLWLFHRRSYSYSTNLIPPLNSLKNAKDGEYELIGLLRCSEEDLGILLRDAELFDMLLNCRG